MIYTDLTRKAITVAYNAHQGQLDRAGLPYILHPLHVAEQMKDEDTCVAALLHDAGVSAKVSATVKDSEDPAFCRHITVTSNSDGCDLVEIEPTGSSAVLNMATGNE